MVDFDKRDLEDHIAVGAYILNDKNELLVLEHVKWGWWSVPVGKGEDGETAEQAFRREVEEELGLTDYKMSKVYEQRIRYNHAGQEVTDLLVGYELSGIVGEPRNLEPEKHRNFGYLPVSEVISKPALSDQLILYLNHKGFEHHHQLEGTLL